MKELVKKYQEKLIKYQTNFDKLFNSIFDAEYESELKDLEFDIQYYKGKIKITNMILEDLKGEGYYGY